MGQKVHPLGFRVGVNKNYRSKWFSNLGSYSSLLFEDYLIRNCIISYFDNLNNKKNLIDSINVTDVIISRKFDQTNVSIYIASINNLIVDGSNLLNNLKSNKIVDNLQKLLTTKVRSLNVNYSDFKIPSRIEGRIPLQTLTANIQYCNDVAHTKYGLLGIKIWVYNKNN